MGDFYRFASFFADVEEVDVGRQQENLKLPTPEQQQQLQRLDTQISALQSDSKTSDLAIQTGGSNDEAGGPANQLKRLEQRRDELRAQIRRTLVTKSVAPRMTRILARGNWLDESGNVVEPAIPAMFGHPGFDAVKGTRLDLASWLVAPENPLTARVFVNHLWRIMFGQGLVRTPDDFGAQGQYPTHPEVAGLAGRRVSGKRLGRQAYAASDSAVSDLSPGLNADKSTST